MVYCKIEVIPYQHEYWRVFFIRRVNLFVIKKLQFNQKQNNLLLNNLIIINKNSNFLTSGIKQLSLCKEY